MTAIKVPPLGESIVEATVSRWLKQAGEAVAPGDTLVELETDKITVEVPALSGGVLVSQAVKEGDVVNVDQLLGELQEGAVAAPAASAPAAAPTAPAAAGTALTSAPPAPTSAAPAPAPLTSSDVKASPAAVRVAAERGVDLGSVTGTGRGGVVSKPDVIEHAAGASAPVPAAPLPVSAPSAPAAAPAAPATPRPAPATGERETREKMTTRRKRIAENLLLAQHSTAHLTTFNEIDMSAVSAVRERLKEKTEQKHGVKLSFMPFFVKAATMALKAFPVVNAQIDGDSIVYKHYVNMGIAVASEAGLVVPNVKDADRKGMLDISRDIAGLAKKARDG